MLTTNELEIHIRKKLNSSNYKEMLINDLEKYYIFSNNFTSNRFGPINFIYSNDLSYHICSIGDRGAFQKDEKTYNLVELGFSIFWDISFRLSTPPLFIVSNFSGDWRRWSFKKRLEILSSIDKEYELYGQQKIDEILKNNPYNDDLEV